MRWCIRVIKCGQDTNLVSICTTASSTRKEEQMFEFICKSQTLQQIFFSHFWSLDGCRFVYFLVTPNIQKGRGGVLACADQYLESIWNSRPHSEADGELKRILGTSVKSFATSCFIHQLAPLSLHSSTLWSVCTEISNASLTQSFVIYP